MESPKDGSSYRSSYMDVEYSKNVPEKSVYFHFLSTTQSGIIKTISFIFLYIRGSSPQNCEKYFTHCFFKHDASLLLNGVGVFKITVERFLVL